MKQQIDQTIDSYQADMVEDIKKLIKIPSLTGQVKEVRFALDKTLELAGKMGFRTMIIGLDFDTILKGRLPGYLLCLGAIITWNMYNFITSHLGGRYQPLTLTFNQLTCTVLLSLPIAMANLPDPSKVTAAVVGEVLYLGIVSGGIGFYIYVAALYTLGPTTVSVYANFMKGTSPVRSRARCMFD